jgi:hypothetical protein
MKATIGARVNVISESQEMGAAEIKAQEGRTYSLPNSGQLFEGLKIEKVWAEGYVVVGFKTIIRSELSEGELVGMAMVSDKKGDGDGIYGKEGVQAVSVDTRAVGRGFEIKEEMVWAVQYRKIQSAWMAGGSLKLEEVNRWEIMWGQMRS